MPPRKPSPSSSSRAKQAGTAGTAGLNGDARFEVSAESRLTPLLPENLATPELFQAGWRRDGRRLFEKCRELAQSNDFVERVLRLKLAYFNDRFRFDDPDALVDIEDEEAAVIPGDEEDDLAPALLLPVAGSAAPAPPRPPTPLEKWLRAAGYDFHQVVSDAWIESLCCDNVVAFWKKPEPGDSTLPPVTILDCEDVEVSNVFGSETVKVYPKKVTLSDEQKAALPERYVKAIEKGSFILGHEFGEYWKILKRGKSGGCLTRPRLGAVLDELSLRDLLELGDWAGAWTMKDVIRHVTKGHKIDNGPQAGSAKHFLTKAQRKQVFDQLKNKGGAFTAVTNFDIKFAYPFLDPRFFDESKYHGVMSRLRAWAGAVEEMREAKGVSPYLLRMFEAEGFYERGRMARLLDGIFNDPGFCGENPPPVPLRCAWNPHSFKSAKDLLDWVRCGANGLVSPQTQREAMGVNDRLETARMKAAAKNKAGYTPPFEPRQGLLQSGNKGGRPTDTPAGDTAPAE